MMNEDLIEEGIIKECRNGLVKVELLFHEECENCSAKIICSQTSDKSRVLELEDSVNSKVGDRVQIIIPGSQLTKLSLKLYLIPLIIVLAVIYSTLNVASDTSNSELISVAVAFFSLAVYYIGFKKMAKIQENDKSQKIILLKLN